MDAWEEEDQGQLLRENQYLARSSPPPSLLDLASLNLDLDYFLEHRDEFYQLPVPVVDQLMLRCKKLRSPKYFPLLIKPGSRSVLVPCYRRKSECHELWSEAMDQYSYTHLYGRKQFPWTQKELEDAMELIKENCAGTLETFGFCTYESSEYQNCKCYDSPTDLELKTCMEITKLSKEELVGPPQPKPILQVLNDIIRDQPNLKELRMPHLVVKNDTLSILADTCHQLRSLTFDHGPDLDMNTMQKLVIGCPLLEDFNASIHEEEISNYAIQKLKKLVFFSPHLKFTTQFCTYLKAGGTLSPNFHPSLDCPNSRFKNITSLLCNAVNLKNCAIKSVEKLHVRGIHHQDHAQYLETFLKRCGPSIKELTLDNYRNNKTPLDLSKIFHYCPKLIHLDIKNIYFTTACKYEIGQEQVKNLRCLAIKSEMSVPVIPPDQVLYPVVCNGGLEHFRVPILNSGFVARLTKEMREKVGESKPSPVFPELTLMEVYKVGEERMTLSQGISLITLAPKLRDVRFPLKKEDLELLKSFVNKYRAD